jgi:hypothetical protein
MGSEWVAPAHSLVYNASICGACPKHKNTAIPDSTQTAAAACGTHPVPTPQTLKICAHVEEWHVRNEKIHATLSLVMSWLLPISIEKSRNLVREQRGNWTESSPTYVSWHLVSNPQGQLQSWWCIFFIIWSMLMERCCVRLLILSLSYLGKDVEMISKGQVRYCKPVILAHGRLSQEACEFEASLGYKARPYLKQNQTTQKNLCSKKL